MPGDAAASAGNARITKRLIVAGILVILVVVAIVKLVGFADTIRYRTPEQKRLWFEEKVKAHEQAIRKYADAQEAKGIFHLISVDVSVDGVSYQIEQLSDPNSTDITPEAEKFRGKLLSMLGSYTPVYIDTYYPTGNGTFWHVGTNTVSVAKSNMPGIEEGDTYPGKCYRLTGLE